jgi:phosphoribosylformylglycinamidine synthase subunit PurL
LLGREPNHFELAVFSLLWSEHCGYKHSAPLLRRLPGSGPRVLQGPGENAGVIDLGEGEAVAFKVESHNHPSAVEPFQGAATGVGGILRDIVAMGARPVALLDGLRFGSPGWDFRRAVAGIGHYGNCLSGDETILMRNSGRVSHATVAEVAHERGPSTDGPSWTVPPRKTFELLSIDPVTHEPQWCEVARVFKRQARRLRRFRTALGRTIAVTPDHPMMVCTETGLEERPAWDVQPGDRLPLLAALPTETAFDEVDVINVADDTAVVVLPDDWAPSLELRRTLLDLMPRADARHYWLSRRELPVPIFRAVESDVGVERQELRIRLRGPRSNVVPAVLVLDADFARLIGYYLAEGCASDNGTTTKIIWTFGRTERERSFVDDVARILRALRIRHSVEDRRSTIAVTVSSRLLAAVFREALCCGSRSHEKAIPMQILTGQVSLRRELLRGLFRGDGSLEFPKRGSRVRVRHSTTSRRLHEQVLLLVQSLGIFPSVFRRDARQGEIQGRIVNSRTAYQLEIGAVNGEVAEWFTTDEAADVAARIAQPSAFAHPAARRESRTMASVQVTGVDDCAGSFSVYDFEVPQTHLFVTSGGIVTHNCVGVPTVGGEAVFDEAYAGNCLVNAMCVGLLPAERVTRAQARGTGNAIVLYGATTGRDGIGGASVLASQELGEGPEPSLAMATQGQGGLAALAGRNEKRPSVQIGDPFTGKKLIEASLELVEAGLVESLQDCGAAGLASALAEMARGESGVDVHLDRVPLREDGMEPWEIMISESQERMVAVCRPESIERVGAVLDRWKLHHDAIGEVTETGELRAFFEDELVGEIPARLLTDECPRYEVDRLPAARPRAQVDPVNYEPKRWIYEQYDHLVQSRTVRRPGLDAAVLRLRPSWRGLAVSLDGPPLGCRDPREAGRAAVLGAARNVACAGGEPLALTDCLNFGNPEKPEIGWELAEAIEGIAEAAEALGIPVVSGNVSLYNETEGRAIPPTPVVGCVGLVPDVREVPRGWQPGDRVWLAEGDEVELIGWLWRNAPRFSLAHDVSDGGLRQSLIEASAFSGHHFEVEDEAAYGSVVLAGPKPDWPQVRKLGTVA